MHWLKCTIAASLGQQHCL